MTFIIHYKNGRKMQYINAFDEDDEQQNKAGWIDVGLAFKGEKDIAYIEQF